MSLHRHSKPAVFLRFAHDDAPVLLLASRRTGHAIRSPRQEYADRFPHPISVSDETQLEFMCWGRGMSYHELDLALSSVDNLTIVSSLIGFLKKRSLPYRTMHRFSRNGRYAAFFRRLYPQFHPCFFDAYLDFIILK